MAALDTVVSNWLSRWLVTSRVSKFFSPIRMFARTTPCLCLFYLLDTWLPQVREIREMNFMYGVAMKIQIGRPGQLVRWGDRVIK